MALATQCPFCQTTFRVAGDQLKLRGGLVRCGHCNEVFDGNAHLLQEQQGSDSGSSGNWPRQTPVSSPPTAPITPAIARANAAAPNYGQPVPDALPDASAMAEIEAAWDLPPSPADNTAIENTDAGDALMIEGERDDKGGYDLDIPPLLLHPSSPPHDDEPHDGDTRDWNVDDWDAHVTKTEPYSRHSPGADTYRDERSAEAPAHIDEPVEQLEFILAAQRRQQRARVRRLFMIVFSVLLIFTGLAQGVYLERNRIAAAVPSLKPTLIAACRPLRCTVGLQKQIDQLSIESNELQAATPDQPTLILNILLRNRADIPLAWPDIELTLNDDDEKALVRRVFTPAEYLPSLQLIDGGIAGDGEQAVKLSFTMTQGAASGYRVYLFYP